jgi:biopolymer transport protein ExbD
MTRTTAARFVSPVTPPGARLLQRVPLRLLSAARRRGRRQLGFELPLVSFIDCLLCVVLFLLGSFSANADCPERQRVPSAENGGPNVDAPVVAVTRERLLLDGIPVGSVEEIASHGRLTRVDGLFDALKNKRELWKQLNPGADFPGTVILQVDRTVSSLVVKSAFQTAAYAGYPNIAFLVKQR